MDNAIQEPIIKVSKYHTESKHKWGIRYYDKHGVIVEEWYDTEEERDTIFHTIHDPDNGVEYVGEDNEFGEEVIRYEKRRILLEDMQDYTQSCDLEETLLDIFNGDYTLDAFRQDYENWLDYRERLKKL